MPKFVPKPDSTKNETKTVAKKLSARPLQKPHAEVPLTKALRERLPLNKDDSIDWKEFSWEKFDSDGLTKEEQDFVLEAHWNQPERLAARKRHAEWLKEMVTEAPDVPPTAAEEEAFLRDFACLGLLLSGASDEQVKEIDSILDAECDGSRVREVERIARKVIDPVYAFYCSPDFLEQIADDIRQLGVEGEEELALTIYLVAVSRLLDKPLSAIVQGFSGAGKSMVVETVKRLIPKHSRIDATSMSPKALYYKPPGSLKNKVVFGGEMSRKTDDDSADATAAMRQLLSEGQITQQVTMYDSVTKKWETKEVCQEGPVAKIETTTLSPERMFAENLNRCLLLHNDCSEEQTQRIIEANAKRYESESKGKSRIVAVQIIEKHHRFQDSLEKKEILIPFASRLAELLPTTKIEVRRIFNQVLSVIEVVALLHQHQRTPDSEGRIVATSKDYAVARRLLTRPLVESLGANKHQRVIFDQLKLAFKSNPFTTTQAQSLFEKDGQDRTVRKWLEQLAGLGCIQKTKEGKGRGGAAEWVIVRSPDESLLPSIEEIFGEPSET